MFYLKIFKDNEKRTPLHAAAYLGDAEIIELLILSGKHSSILIYKCSSLLLVFFFAAQKCYHNKIYFILSEIYSD